MKTVEVSSFLTDFTPYLFQDETYLPFSPADSPSGADSLLETCR